MNIIATRPERLDFIEKWAEELEGDNYYQTYGMLCDMDYEGVGTCKPRYRHCALGVACSLLGVDNKDLDGTYSIGHIPGYKNKYINILWKYLLCDEGMIDRIMDLNDIEKYTFPQIAEALRDYVANLKRHYILS